MQGEYKRAHNRSTAKTLALPKKLLSFAVSAIVSCIRKMCASGWFWQTFWWFDKELRHICERFYLFFCSSLFTTDKWNNQSMSLAVYFQRYRRTQAHTHILNALLLFKFNYLDNRSGKKGRRKRQQQQHPQVARATESLFKTNKNWTRDWLNDIETLDADKNNC